LSLQSENASLSAKENYTNSPEFIFIYFWYFGISPIGEIPKFEFEGYFMDAERIYEIDLGLICIGRGSDARPEFRV